MTVEGARVGLDVIADDCQSRRMILDRSRWLPPGAETAVAERRIVRTAGTAQDAAAAARPSAPADWPSFRGREASGVSDRQNLPDTWNPATGENILWRTPIPGLAHSSPIVAGDTVYVTSAISGKGNATFKPGLYGDGDASDDRSIHRWMLYAIDKRTGKIRWERTAVQSEPANKRHIKSTYASASPATDGRIVVAWFGSQGIYAYDVDGGLRWSVDLGRVDMGAYDIPAYEWGPASSPIIWNGMVIVQCDTQADSFLLALDAETGETIWKTDRQELPSWGTPTIVTTPAGAELITNASNFVRGYDPKTGKELWKLGGSSKITAPTPIFAEGLHIITSGRAPERPVFAVRPGARGDLTLAKDATDQRERGVEQDRPRLLHADAARLSRHRLRARQQRRPRRLRPADGQGDLPPAPARWSAAATAPRRSRPTARSICRMKTGRCWWSRRAGRSSTLRRTQSERC